MTKMEVVEFVMENTAEWERSFSETSGLTGLIQIKHMRNLHPCSPWKGLVRGDQTTRYTQAEDWFPSCTTALSSLCSTSYPTLDAPNFPPCTWLQVAFAISVT